MADTWQLDRPYIQGGIMMMLRESPLRDNLLYVIEQYVDENGDYEPFIRLTFPDGRQYRLVVEQMPEQNPCECQTCDEVRRVKAYTFDGNLVAYNTRFMIVCPSCGNKRCPRATYHGNPCTGSNDSGQPGSHYQ